MDRETRQELLELTDRMAELQREKGRLAEERERLYRRCDPIRARCLVKIALEKDEKGKPLYSNEQLRRAASTLELESDQEYPQIQGQIRESLTRERELDIEHARLGDRRVILMADAGMQVPTAPPSLPYG